MHRYRAIGTQRDLVFYGLKRIQTDQRVLHDCYIIVGCVCFVRRQVRHVRPGCALMRYAAVGHINRNPRERYLRGYMS